MHTTKESGDDGTGEDKRSDILILSFGARGTDCILDAGEDERGDILIPGLGARGTDCILDVQVTNTDAKS